MTRKWLALGATCSRSRVCPSTQSDTAVAYTGFFFGGGVTPGILSVAGGVQQIQMRTESRENRDLGVVAP
jgi:hypothetical protein